MKATQVLDARRNVKKQIVSYISIMVIAMVAVSAYLGIAYPAAALRKGASDYYSRYRFWDLEVVSTMLMDEADLEALRAIPGVKAVEGAYELSGDLLLENRIESISIIGVPDEISLACRHRSSPAEGICDHRHFPPSRPRQLSGAVHALPDGV